MALSGPKFLCAGPNSNFPRSKNKSQCPIRQRFLSSPTAIDLVVFSSWIAAWKPTKWTYSILLEESFTEVIGYRLFRGKKCLFLTSLMWYVLTIISLGNEGNHGSLLVWLLTRKKWEIKKQYEKVFHIVFCFLLLFLSCFCCFYCCKFPQWLWSLSGLRAATMNQDNGNRSWTST